MPTRQHNHSLMPTAQLQAEPSFCCSSLAPHKHNCRWHAAGKQSMLMLLSLRPSAAFSSSHHAASRLTALTNADDIRLCMPD